MHDTEISISLDFTFIFSSIVLVALDLNNNFFPPNVKKLISRSKTVLVIKRWNQKLFIMNKAQESHDVISYRRHVRSLLYASH